MAREFGVIELDECVLTGILHLDLLCNDNVDEAKEIAEGGLQSLGFTLTRMLKKLPLFTSCLNQWSGQR